METVSLAEAKAQLSKLIDKVESGEEVVITRHGRAVARVAPVEQPREPIDFETAKQFVLRYETALRAGDALHLAIARNNNAQAIYSLDDKMIRAGKLLGLPVSRGIRAR